VLKCKRLFVLVSGYFGEALRIVYSSQSGTVHRGVQSGEVSMEEPRSTFFAPPTTPIHSNSGAYRLHHKYKPIGSLAIEHDARHSKGSCHWH